MDSFKLERHGRKFNTCFGKAWLSQVGRWTSAVSQKLKGIVLNSWCALIHTDDALLWDLASLPYDEITRRLSKQAFLALQGKRRPTRRIQELFGRPMRVLLFPARVLYPECSFLFYKMFGLSTCVSVL